MIDVPLAAYVEPEALDAASGESGKLFGSPYGVREQNGNTWIALEREEPLAPREAQLLTGWLEAARSWRRPPTRRAILRAKLQAGADLTPAEIREALLEALK